MARDVLDLIPVEVAQFSPTTISPVAHRDDGLQFASDTHPSVGGTGIDSRHYSIHEAPHGSEACSMHQTTLSGRLSPSFRERLFDRVPVSDQSGPNALRIRFPGRDIPVREQTTRRG